jgi:hypothetical protein
MEGTPLLTESQQTLQTTVRDFLRDKYGISYARSCFEDSNAAQSLESIVSELALFEYFSDTTKPPFVELALIAEECGRVVFPHALSSILLGAAYYNFSPSALVVRVPSILTTKEGAYIELPYLVGAKDMASLLCIVESRGHTQGAYLIPRAAIEMSDVEPLDRTQRVSTVRIAQDTFFNSAITLAHNTVLLQLMILASAELVGIAAAVGELTREYSQVREQYGAAIGTFQAVQHAQADMYLESESVRALTRFAAWSIDTAPRESMLASFSALYRAIEVVPAIVEKAIQLHGGIGFTWEHDLHLYLRRARSISALWSDFDFSRMLSVR